MPLFIVGFPRSGTTLCQSLIARQLGIPTLPETHFFERLDDHEPAGGRLRPDAARALLDELAGFLDLHRPDFEPLLTQPAVPIRALFLQIIAAQIGSPALADKGLWMEKTPGHADNLERIVQMFPRARFICMVRNPTQAFASRRELMAPGKGWGETWKPIEALCTQWAQHLQRMRDFDARHPGQLLRLRLEDIAADAEAALVRIRAFVGPGFARPVAGPPQGAIIQPFETWKRDALGEVDPAISRREGKPALDDFETWRVSTLLRDEMAAFGYAVDAPEPPLDDLHRRLLAGLDWYRESFRSRDALMDVKTARIRQLLAERVPARPPAPAAADEEDDVIDVDGDAYD